MTETCVLRKSPPHSAIFRSMITVFVIIGIVGCVATAEVSSNAPRCGSWPVKTLADTSSKNKAIVQCVASNLPFRCTENSGIRIHEFCYGKHRPREGTSCKPHNNDCIIKVKSYPLDAYKHLEIKCENQTSCNHTPNVINSTRKNCKGHMDYVFVAYSCETENKITTVSATQKTTNGKPAQITDVSEAATPVPQDGHNGEISNQETIIIVCVVAGVVLVIAVGVIIYRTRHGCRKSSETMERVERDVNSNASTSPQPARQNDAPGNNGIGAIYSTIPPTHNQEGTYGTVIVENSQYDAWVGTGDGQGNRHSDQDNVTEMVENEQYSAWKGTSDNSGNRQSDQDNDVTEMVENEQYSTWEP